MTRVLKFIVEDQIIKKDPNCDFDDLVPGTEGYLQASFSFSSEWKTCAKVVSFWSMLGKEYEPQILKDGNICDIPEEALRNRSFKIQLIGRKPNGMQLKTNKVVVTQNGGR